jgi:hypothetical protein
MSKLLVDEISDADNTGPVTVTDGLTVQGAFTSLGIDDNATSTAITLDASGNLLVGTTSNNIYGGTTTGINLNPDGATSFNRASGQAAMFNRISTDGDIVQFRKDGTTVGSIGSNSGTNMIMGTGATGIYFNEASQSVHPWNISDNQARNGAIDLGRATDQFRYLYLNGGVVFGTTGGSVSSKTLDDYEEGYHAVTLTTSNGGSITLSATQRYLSYTKIGNRVFVTGKVDISSVSSPLGHVKISLPFAIDATSPSGTNDSRRTAGSIWITNSSINITHFVLYGIENESAMRIYVGDGTQNQDTTGQKLSGSHGVAFTFNYRTA